MIMSTDKAADKPVKKHRLNNRMLIIIPVILFLFSASVIANQYFQTGEFFLRSIDMKGGTLVTINTQDRLDANAIETQLSQKFQPISIREISSFKGFGTVIETSNSVKAEDVLAELKAMGIDTSSNDVETIGPALGASFWFQAQLAIVIAFIFMAVVVFVIFRTFVPAGAVVLSAFCDIFMTLGFMQLFGIELSLAGLAAILMLIGYSVDTDILLTSRLLKNPEDDTLDEKLKHALKTGLTMSLTAISALLPLLLLGVSPVITQIATVLLIGLAFDIMNTWITNYAILQWYCEKRGMK
jgi:preprotein translocase subunit SecF